MAFHSEQRSFGDIEKCPECGTLRERFIKDYRKKELVCPKCGLVVGRLFLGR